MSKYDVYGIGNALVDMEFTVGLDLLSENNIEKGLMTLVDEARQAEIHEIIGNVNKRACGGSAANSIIAVSQFGGKSFYSCKVAEDDAGHFYMQDMKNNHVDTNLNEDALPPGKTGKCFVMITPDADRTMNTFLGITATINEEVIVEEAIKNSKWVYVEGYLVTSENGLNTALKTLELARKHNVKTSLTFSDPGIVKFFRENFKKLTNKKLDLVFCNETEAMEITGKEDLFEARTALKDIADTFCITLGPNGATVFDGETFIDIEPYKVNAIDTNGAGDCFAGAFLYGITNGLSYAGAGKLATMASSHLVTLYGPRLSKKQAQEIKGKLK